jgi:Na+/proline symporter
VNALDWSVLIVTILGIALYGIYRTRGQRDLKGYLQGKRDTSWLVIGLSVMATQASAVTFLSTPGQGYESGLGFVQNYFGAPFALILISIVFLPIYRKLNVYTAYEYLGRRFDSKTRLLAAGLFLLQRGIGAGLTIYVPAIVLSTVMDWRLDATIVGSGIIVIAYTALGGSEAVSLTQKYQLGIIFIGMIAAFVIIVVQLMADVSPREAMMVAGGFHKLQAVDFSINLKERYTFWSGLLGGFFLAVSYFGTDQSQVQRYLAGGGLRESRLGLMFNAVFKIPMQFFILLLGALLFVFYQFHPAPVHFNRTEWNQAKQQSTQYEREKFQAIEDEYAHVHSEKLEHIRKWLDSNRAGDVAAGNEFKLLALADHDRSQEIRNRAVEALKSANRKVTKDNDYVFIHFILDRLPHGIIGLLITVFFASTLSSKAAELNALASTTTIDIYRHLVKKESSDAHYVAASKWLTVFWGTVALLFALFVNMAENLIQAVNIIGSIFYGVVLGLFMVAFFMRWITGTAVFIAAIISQLMVFVLFYSLEISYLWYNLIGCVACMLLSAIIQAVMGSVPGEPSANEAAL